MFAGCVRSRFVPSRDASRRAGKHRLQITVTAMSAISHLRCSGIETSLRLSCTFLYQHSFVPGIVPLRDIRLIGWFVAQTSSQGPWIWHKTANSHNSNFRRGRRKSRFPPWRLNDWENSEKGTYFFYLQYRALVLLSLRLECILSWPEIWLLRVKAYQWKAGIRGRM